MKVRACLVRQWEADNSNEALYGGAGKGAQRAAWAGAFHAENAKLTGQKHAQALIDLVKAFEMIPHQELINAAASREYPLKLLRLSLAAYRLQRAVGINGLFAECVRATRGITAGSGHATTELRVLLIDMVAAIQSRWPPASGVNLLLYVDDLTIMATGTEQEVRDKIDRITAFTAHILEEVLRLEISTKKSVITASSPKLAAAIARANTKKSLRPVHSAKVLGTATTAGARRCTKVLQNRVRSFKNVRKRIGKLRKAGVNTAMMARAAGTQAVTYGYATMGIADSALETARREVARAAAPTTAGKNPNMILYTLDGASGTMDPAFEGNAACILAWATAWWESWIPEQQLTEAFNAVSAAAKNKWGSVVGPTAALLATLRRIGWRMTDAKTFVDDIGEIHQVNRDSPEAIRRAANRSTRRWRLSKVGTDRPGFIPEVSSNSSAGSSSSSISRSSRGGTSFSATAKEAGVLHLHECCVLFREANEKVAVDVDDSDSGTVSAL
jgi:hypothetical protein